MTGYVLLTLTSMGFIIDQRYSTADIGLLFISMEVERGEMMGETEKQGKKAQPLVSQSGG